MVASQTIGPLETASYHIPVLRDEVVAALLGGPPGPLVDGTLGGGGHLAALDEATGGTRTLIGIDRDPDAHARSAARFAGRDNVVLVHGNFGDLPAALDRAGIEGQSVAGILLDLGVSSWQLDHGPRGFAFRFADAELDMRMDATDDETPTAAAMLRSLDVAALTKVLRDFGEVKNAHAVAGRIKEAVAQDRMTTTGDLVMAVGGYKRPGKAHPATTVFQAIRIAVNGELDALDAALKDAPSVLAPNGRLAVIAYHSLEDRRVKQAFALGEQGPPRPGHLPPPSSWKQTWKRLTRKPLTASADELKVNPRSRSAKLRVACRYAGTRRTA